MTDDRQFTDGLNIVNIAKLISSIIGGKNQVEKEKLKASEVLPYVFADDFYKYFTTISYPSLLRIYNSSPLLAPTPLC